MKVIPEIRRMHYIRIYVFIIFFFSFLHGDKRMDNNHMGQFKAH